MRGFILNGVCSLFATYLIYQTNENLMFQGKKDIILLMDKDQIQKIAVMGLLVYNNKIISN